MLHRSLKRSLTLFGVLMFLALVFLAISFLSWAPVDALSVSTNENLEVLNDPNSSIDLSISIDGVLEAGRQITFTAHVTNSVGAVTYIWDFGDNSTAPGARVHHTYSVSGNFRVSVLATDATGSTKTAEETIFINPPPTPPPPVIPPPTNLVASCDDTVLESNPFVCRASTSNSNPITYEWNFKDGTGAVLGASVSHTYESPGERTITVIARNSQNESASTDVRVLVNPIGPTGLTITFDKPVLRGYLVNFNAQITGGSNVKYSWSFSDGHAEPGGSSPDGKSSSVIHSFDERGIYMVTVQATNDSGSLTVSEQFEVRSAPPRGLVLGRSGPANPREKITFFANVTEGDDVQYIWDFDNGIYQFGPSVVQDYETPGIYAVAVKASNDIGMLEKPIIAVVGLELIPDLSINASVDRMRTGDEITVAVVSPEAEHKYCWNFHDGSPLQPGSMQSHIYAHPKIYVIEVYSTTSAAPCSDDDEQLKHGYKAVIVRHERLFSLSWGGAKAGARPTATPTPTSTPIATSRNTPVNTFPATAPAATSTPIATPTFTSTSGTTTLPETPTPGSVVLPPPTNP